MFEVRSAFTFVGQMRPWLPVNKQTLRKNDFIQKGLAFFLGVVFTLSITPKPFFHDLLTAHQDEQVCRDQDKSSPHFHKPAFHCSFDELVVSAPFLSVVQQTGIERPQILRPFTTDIPSLLLPLASLLTESRGPPVK